MKSFISILLFAGTVGTMYAAHDMQLLDFSKTEISKHLIAVDARLELSANKLAVQTAHNQDWPGVTIQCPSKFWDCTGYQQITADIRNVSSHPLKIHLRVDNPGADGIRNCITQSITIPSGRRQSLSVRLYTAPWTLDKPFELVGMRGYPQPSPLDTKQINQLIFFVARPTQNYQFEISNLRAEGAVNVLNKDAFIPFIDSFGQFIHADWPGKIRTEQDLITCKEAETAAIAAYPGAEDRNSWGGWSKGPRLKAMGFFRVEKVGPNWWLMDPDGNLFWSHGVDCVGTHSETPVTLRESYFQWLPREDAEWKAFWGRGSWAPVGYYKDKGEYDTFNFAGANLLRKYGKDWYSIHAELCHQRLKSWGMNTIGNWSESSIYRLRKTPYTATLGVHARSIEGSEGYWGKFPDPFDASFKSSLQAAIEREEGKSIGDPWCLGFFVDNELSWGDETSLAMAALASPADQPAKKAFVEWLKNKYKTTDKLNSAWGGSYSSWQEIIDTQKQPDKNKALPDLKAFYSVLAEKYFELISSELKAAAPAQLYLGCRFAWANELAVRAAAKHCDVISFNRYEYSVADLSLPEGIDKPVIIGEFHFGALDRGMFHTGLKETQNQQDRADTYKEYVLGALRNPYIIGTHWFQYRDQATTGRGDGENYQIGLVDICDTPYPETISAVKEVGKLMYKYRYKTTQIQ
ncbi:MAG: beta-galactosidase [Sedimentisphaerales bacterium]|nr:beta-galactosidase [Sedimentisphaerales bacterium]